MPRPAVRSILPFLVVLPLAAGHALAAGTGTPILDLRYRHESVDQAGFARNAHADTLRVRAGYATSAWHGWSVLAEADGVLGLGDGRYNDTRNGQRQYPVIADRPGAEINQALLRRALGKHSATFGRQRINLGNQRFVGGVGWRQNEQTYDGARLQLAPLDALAIDYSYVDGINTVFGPDDSAASSRANPSDIEGHSHLLQVGWKLAPALAASAYHHELKLDGIAVGATAPYGTLDSRTTGLRLEGAQGAWSYAAEYARQRDLDSNPWTLDSRYRLAELGWKVRGVALKAGVESLGGGDGPGNRAFQTPLATKHLFQGWADVFLTTPAQGIDDAYLGATVPLAGGSLQAWYHEFSPERGGGRYGDEVDLSYAHPVPGLKGVAGLVKLARYRSDDPSRTVDTDKLWLQLQYTY
ncbi:alginate export family protein [Pseudoxanthomonas sp. 10H]|uniref:alginate export family protein n=1 Tax=Pseudoxanthomonas sp. 10H TaxID=3242729 RepID=UPI0035584F58